MEIETHHERLSGYATITAPAVQREWRVPSQLRVVAYLGESDGEWVPQGGLVVRATVLFAPGLGRYLVTDVSASASATGVTSTVLGRIPLAEIVTRATSPHVTSTGEPTGEGIDQRAYLDALATARVYMVARATGEPPTKAVADEFGISRSAAAQRVRRARERHLIPPTTRGKVS